jgi:hypothetical protein
MVVVVVKQIIGLAGLLMQNDKAILAQWAKNLLNDDFFKEVIDNLKKEQISVIINTSAEECDRREDAYRHIKTIELITGHLEGLASETVIKEKKWKIL